MEEIVAENQNVDSSPSPLKRRFSEIEQDVAIEQDLFVAKVKTERSMSTGSNLSGITSTSISKVKMEVDEETSKAASILKGVSMDPRNVLEPAKSANLRSDHLNLPCISPRLPTAHR